VTKITWKKAVISIVSLLVILVMYKTAVFNGVSSINDIFINKDALEKMYYLSQIIYVFLTIFLYLLKCPQSLILSALRAFCFCGKPHISRSIFLYFLYQTWLKSW